MCTTGVLPDQGKLSWSEGCLNEHLKNFLMFNHINLLFSFDISNGVTSVRSSLTFTVEHHDRIPPTLSINTGLQLTEGTTRTISPEHLHLTDPDTALENLTYTVIQPPQYGKLLLNGFPMSQTRFTQLDINNMHLSYQHLNSFAKIDTFTFQPSDGTNTGYLEHGQLKEQAAVFTIQARMGFIHKKHSNISFIVTLETSLLYRQTVCNMVSAYVRVCTLLL